MCASLGCGAWGAPGAETSQFREIISSEKFLGS